MNTLRKLFRKITFADFRAYVLSNQARHTEEIKQLKDQVFQSNPILIMHGMRIYLPYFYVDHIQRCIYTQHNFYESRTLTFLKSHYPHIKKIVEVGANIGNHMLFYKMHMGVDEVFCFEPNEVNRKILEKNIELNLLEEKVKVFPVALGEKEASGVQTSFDIKNTGMNRIEVVQHKTENSIDIMPMDSYEFKDIDFIKIDVEGHELPVLKGGLNTIVENKPIVMVEVFDDNVKAVNHFFESIGYAQKHILESHNFIFEYKKG